MKLDLVFTVDDLNSIDIHNKVVVVIDVLRATSTMVTALNNEATSVISVMEIERAVSLKKDDQNSLLCGERNGIMIPGFDRGNSPMEFKDTFGHNLIFSSTNGSRTIEKSKESKKMFLGSFLNAKSLATTLMNDHSKDEILIACSGKLGHACIEDTICAGYIINCLTEIKDEAISFKLDDAAKISKDYYSSNKEDISKPIKGSEHGKYLISINMEKDIDYCCQKDLIKIVPFYDKDKSKIIR